MKVKLEEHDKAVWTRKFIISADVVYFNQEFTTCAMNLKFRLSLQSIVVIYIKGKE